MIVFEIIKIALRSIWGNKMRSSLTMLGLIIGIMAVVIITTLGNAAQADMSEAFEKYGKGKLSVSLSNNADRPVVYRDFFSDDDIQAVAALEDDIAAVSAEIRRMVTIKSPSHETRMTVMGVNHNYDQVETIDIIRGRFLNEEDIKGRRNVLIIDEKAARNLFGTIDCIGEKLMLTTGYQTMEMMIIGVDKMSDSVILNMAQGNYFYGYMPITVASRLYYTDRYPRFMIQAQEVIDINRVGERILSLLVRRSKDPQMYRVYARENEYNQVAVGLGFLTATISGIAGISLIVGGIGIMNIMLVSVTERTREIGIRKAIGAKRSVILLQFLIEAVILSVLGGALGFLLGGMISYGIVTLLKLPFIVSLRAIVLAFVFSTIVGILFGVYPAHKASKLDPIEALRYE